MELSIVKRVAQLISSKKIEASQPGKKRIPTSSKSSVDSVDISEAGTEVKKLTDYVINLPEKDEKRQKKIDELKEKIEQNRYTMPGPVVESIAEKIANMII